MNLAVSAFPAACCVVSERIMFKETSLGIGDSPELAPESFNRTLVIGFGNIDRADDGVAYIVVNALRQALGQLPLNEEETGLEALGENVDSIFLSQLTPEMMDLLDPYDRIIFVDAHVDSKLNDLHCSSVLPEYTTPTFSHHLTPAMLLAFLKVLYHREPAAHLVSIRGYDFDFHRDLSADTAAQVSSAVQCILNLVKSS
jgi:hydrogenase maturation protease